MEFSRQEYWSGLLFPSPGGLPDPRRFLTTEPPGKPDFGFCPSGLSLLCPHQWPKPLPALGGFYLRMLHGTRQPPDPRGSPFLISQVLSQTSALKRPPGPFLRTVTPTPLTFPSPAHLLHSTHPLRPPTCCNKMLQTG